MIWKLKQHIDQKDQNKYCKEQNNIIRKIETNIWAVEWECVCYLATGTVILAHERSIEIQSSAMTVPRCLLLMVKIPSHSKFSQLRGISHAPQLARGSIPQCEQ